MGSFETVIYEKRDSIAEVTLNRPQVLNRYNIRMRDELYQVLTAIGDDPDVLAVIFKGAGERAFCVGADLTEFGTAPSPIAARRARWERDVWGVLSSLKQPLIAALHGFTFGSGMELALFCDIRIASEDAVFALPEVSLGMIPAAGGTQTLPRIAGRGNALQMLLASERIDAKEAWRRGLVNMVVSREELYPNAEAMAHRIASHNPIAVRYAKEAVRRGLDLQLGEGVAMERALANVSRGLAVTGVTHLASGEPS